MKTKTIIIVGLLIQLVNGRSSRASHSCRSLGVRVHFWRTFYWHSRKTSTASFVFALNAIYMSCIGLESIRLYIIINISLLSALVYHKLIYFAHFHCTIQAGNFLSKTLCTLILEQCAIFFNLLCALDKTRKYGMKVMMCIEKRKRKKKCLFKLKTFDITMSTNIS